MVTRWEHTKAYEQYPTEPGTVWRVGDHTLGCFDLEAGTLYTFVEQFHIDILYSDPPWNAGNARMFRSQAGDTSEDGKGRKVDFFGAFVPKLIEVMKLVNGPVFTECGKRECDQQLLAYRHAGSDGGQVFYVKYGGKPHRLIQTAFRTGWNQASVHVPLGTESEDLPKLVLSQLSPKNKIVLDPCCGLGATPAACHAVGARALCCELNPRRLAESVKRMVKLTGIEAKRG